jgi:ferredoxin
MLGEKALDILTPAACIQVDLTRCVHRRFSRTSCRRCAEACPSGALRIEKGPLIDGALCTNCRRCESVCPTGALRGDEREIGDLASSLAQSPRPVLGCRMQGVQAHVHTGCLGFLDVEGLLALGLLFPEGLTLNLTRCRECSNSAILPGLEKAAEEVRRLLGGSAGKGLRLAGTDRELRYQEVNLSRREFFTFMRRRSADTASLAATRLQQAPPKPDGSRKILPTQRRLLLRALPLLPSDIRRDVEDALFPLLHFGQICTGCTGCAGMCPTGAITGSAADPPQPVFFRHFCTDCRLCADFCRKGGIIVEAAVKGD